MSLFDAIRKAARPEEVFIETPDGTTLTYADMLDYCGRMASVLAQLSVQPGDRVAVQVEKCPQFLMLYLACLRAGAVFLPLNPDYTNAEVAWFVEDAAPRLLVVDPAAAADMAEIAGKFGARLETLDGKGGGSLHRLAAAAKPDFADVARAPGDLAAILYTSGTTGRSKGAMLTHENLLSNALTLKELWRFTAADRLIHALPVFHTHGLFVATNIILLSGASMLFLPKFDAETIVRLVPLATCYMGVPTHYVRLLQHEGLTREAASAMRLFVSGSAPLLEETHRQFRERTGHAILERYGMTETNMNTSNPYDGERRAGTVGFPLPGVSLRIVDPQSGGSLAPGEIGIIEVAGPNVFKGYWRMPERSATDFRADGFFITGDLGRIDAQGYVHIVGREKDLVISGGFNIYPKEIEDRIDRLPGVVESAVFGVPHPDFGEGLTAAVIRAAGADLDEAAVLGGLKDVLARYKQPKRVIFMDSLPRNAMGKVQKNVLRETWKTLYREDHAQPG